MIVYTKPIDDSRIHMAFNNNILRFYSDNEATTLSCDVTIGPVALTLYPDPNGQFFINLKPYLSALVNTRNFEDTLQTEITGTNPNSFIYDASDGTYILLSVTLNLHQTGADDENSFSLHCLAGVEQPGDYNYFTEGNLLLLTPFKKDSANNYYLKYWQGYPFDISICNHNNTLGIKNETNLISQSFNLPGMVSRLFLSDGDDDETLEDVLTLNDGFNKLSLTTIDADKFLSLEKVPYKCGVYLKWFNKYGGYSYWLFENTYSIDRSTKQLGELDRDNANLEDTLARTIQIGKDSQDTYKIIAELLTDDERRIVEGILDSPKIYLFTGRPYARNDYHNWIEVSLKTSSARIKNPRQQLTNFTFDIELPMRYTQTL